MTTFLAEFCPEGEAMSLRNLSTRTDVRSAQSPLAQLDVAVHSVRLDALQREHRAVRYVGANCVRRWRA